MVNSQGPVLEGSSYDLYVVHWPVLWIHWVGGITTKGHKQPMNLGNNEVTTNGGEK